MQWPVGFNRAALAQLDSASVNAMLAFYGVAAPAGVLRSRRNQLAAFLGTHGF